MMTSKKEEMSTNTMQDGNSLITKDDPNSPLSPKAIKAIEIWEIGVEKEKDGKMTDAIKYYRDAIRLFEGVEKLYRKKLHDEWIIFQKMEKLNLENTAASNDTEDGTDKNDGEPKEILPCWILEMLPNDILLNVVNHTVLQSGEGWFNLSLTCSKFNELCFHNSLPYITFSNYIYPKQIYDESAMTLNGISNIDELEKELWNNDSQLMLQVRPYIKFDGIYISVVNYLRHGSNIEGSSSLLNPIHMITYYRYLRFYPNGECLRLTTTDEPSSIVKLFDKEHKPKGSDLCRWSLGFEDNFSHVTIMRSDEKYTYREELQIKHHGHKRNQRLKWVISSVIDKEGTVSECSLRNEKTFFFSRVKSYSQHKGSKVNK
ncbi:hypothetical protein TPHA_0A01700 [Tetrapisispora phaffii CBS 4417]|uniref:F-box protein Hrt3/FBXO9 C-terminal domain-containing protein n=1 Tax=Tetrapisispora phaffii (strain ATCC 24235 / CBS 4417 / NBRC 1672 / NRRL Y-8282 / UCD 70-5) TaxID=1071381 RepID=G8BMX5_TETPH|nr:hypothetical protein TPHA_0A01700 [Tetrapisispora phaffii CBS 4417]CCE61253.1 hypothetical protein TPHA_0A01700 [Tetrapisispora phaffii CBS 4417]